MQPSATGKLITTAKASALLGVKPETLYAYVSRGLPRTAGRNKKRQSLYLASDIKRLQQNRRRGAPLESPMRFGDPVMDSAITRITPEELYYRGYGLAELAESGSFAAVCQLLWSGSCMKVRLWRGLKYWRMNWSWSL